MNKLIGISISLLLLSLSGALPAADDLYFGMVTFNSPAEHIVTIDETPFLADNATLINGANPGGEKNLVQLLAQLPPGADVMYTIARSISESGFAVLKSISQNAP